MSDENFGLLLTGMYILIVCVMLRLVLDLYGDDDNE